MQQAIMHSSKSVISNEIINVERQILFIEFMKPNIFGSQVFFEFLLFIPYLLVFFDIYIITYL